MKQRIILITFILLSLGSFAQESKVYIGTNIPLFYKIGYQQKIIKPISLKAEFGVLTKPYDKAIVSIIKSFDSEDALWNTIGEAFTYGLNFQLSLQFHLKKWYAGICYSYLQLNAKDCPADLIQNYYGISIPTRRLNSLELQSNLQNAGLEIGRTFYLKNPKFSIDLALSCLKSFTSKSTLKNKGTELARLSDAIDSELSSCYKDYGYLPSLNVSFAYKFGE